MSRGRGYEWTICKELSLAFTNGKREDVFSPTDTSGARATMRKKAGKTTEGQHGDITYNDPIGKPLIDLWNCECKIGYGTKRKNKEGIVKTNWCVLDLIDSQQKETQLESFWKQCCRDAEITKREPVLIFRRNNRSTCIAFRTNYFGDPEEDYGPYIYLSNLDIFIFNFKEFLKSINFDFIINPLKDRRNEEKTEEIETTCKPKTSRKKQLLGV